MERFRISRTFSRLLFSITPTSHFLELRVKRFAQTVGEHVEAEHQRRQNDDRRENLIRMRREAIECVADEGAEGAHRHRDAEADEAQEGFGENRSRNAEHQLRDDLADTILVEQFPRLEGRQMIMMIAPARKKAAAPKPVADGAAGADSAE